MRDVPEDSRDDMLPGMGRIELILICGLMGLMLHGCAVDPHRDRPVPPTVGSEVSERNLPWPYWPVTMRVHPLSRLLPEGQTGSHLGVQSDERIYDLYLEFRDEDDIVCRAYGHIHVYWYDEKPTDESIIIKDADIYDLRIPAVNRGYFDDVTRTYLWGQKIPANKLRDKLWLRVYLFSANGQDLYLEDEITLSERP